MRSYSLDKSTKTSTMSISPESDWSANNARHSHLARFTDRFRETMSMKRAPTPPQPQHARAPSRAESTHDENGTSSSRRSSSIRYTDRVMQMFTVNRQSSSTVLNMNDLPVEILQNIFLDLDIFNLLRIRRVCKLWKDLIPGDSPLLAESLFLKPSHNLHAYSFTGTTFDFDFEINPRSRSAHDESQYLRTQPTYADGLNMTRRCLGLIRTSGEIIFHPIIVDLNNYIQGDETGKSKLVMNEARPAEPVHWRNMLVSMPPLTELRISRTVERKLRVVCVLQAKDGIRLGNVLETLETWGRNEVDGSG